MPPAGAFNLLFWRVFPSSFKPKFPSAMRTFQALTFFFSKLTVAFLPFQSEIGNVKLSGLRGFFAD
jgi:hypothetical protein